MCWRSDRVPGSSHVRGRRVIMTNYQEISFTVRHREKLTSVRVGFIHFAAAQLSRPYR